MHDYELLILVTYQHTVSQHNGVVQLKGFVEEGYSVLPDRRVGKDSLVEPAQRFITATGKAIACRIFEGNCCHFTEGVCVHNGWGLHTCTTTFP